MHKDWFSCLLVVLVCVFELGRGERRGKAAVGCDHNLHPINQNQVLLLDSDSSRSRFHIDYIYRR